MTEDFFDEVVFNVIKNYESFSLCIVLELLPLRGKKIWRHAYNKQLLDEVEHDVMNYQNLVPVLSAEAESFDNSWYHAKTKFNNCFIIHFSHNSSSETEAKRSAILFLRRTLQGA